MATKKTTTKLKKYQGVDSSQVKTAPKDSVAMNPGYKRMYPKDAFSPPPGWKPSKKKVGGSIKSKSKKK